MSSIRVDRALIILVSISLLASDPAPVGAASAARRCRQACGGLITACAGLADEFGFGDLRRGCKQAVLRRCKDEGTAACVGFCGDGIAGDGEACDEADLGGQTCERLGFAAGTLACATGCAFDTSDCTPFPPPSQLPNTCGNGVRDGVESCDGTDLGGTTCASLGFAAGILACTGDCRLDTRGCRAAAFPATGQIAGWGVTADKNDGIAGPVPVPDDGTAPAGAPLAFVDNGDGTITDLNTGLMWEKKSDDGGLHDKDNRYVWSGNGSQETIWDWLEDVNAEAGAGFAGFADWRIPNTKELQSIIDYRGGPDPVFNSVCSPGCTVLTCSCSPEFLSDVFWSSTRTRSSFATLAFSVDFGQGFVLEVDEGLTLHVRAVRGGGSVGLVSTGSRTTRAALGKFAAAPRTKRAHDPTATGQALARTGAPAGAAAAARRCPGACAALITACRTLANDFGFGDLGRGCRQAVLKRCKQQGPEVCAAFCGDGAAGAGEDCDENDLGGQTCQSLGFAAGRLACAPGCTFETSGCTPFPPPLPPPMTCGNGVRDGVESCDGADLGGTTCGSLGFSIGRLACTADCRLATGGCRAAAFPATGQVEGATADKNDGIAGRVPVPSDGTVRAGAPLAYQDNGDGTISDLNTGLMWEKKSDDGSLHDKDNRYLWSGDGSQETIWDWLDDVNAEAGAGFAGHSDWRIPNVKEVLSIGHHGSMLGVDPIFDDGCAPGCTVGTCSCTLGDAALWSSTAALGSSGYALGGSVGVFHFEHRGVLPVRAVRGGP